MSAVVQAVFALLFAVAVTLLGANTWILVMAWAFAVVWTAAYGFLFILAEMADPKGGDK